MAKDKEKKNKDIRPEEETETPETVNEEAPQETPAEPTDESQKALEAAEAKAEEYLNLAQRVQADFDNFRKRNASVRAEAFEDGAREFIKTLLPVVDNLERALSSETTDEKLREGVDMTYRMLTETLSKRGVTVIDRKGEKFDPRYENAVMRCPADQGEPGTVAQVFQKGYAMGNTVLRFAMVQVVEEA